MFLPTIFSGCLPSLRVLTLTTTVIWPIGPGSGLHRDAGRRGGTIGGSERSCQVFKHHAYIADDPSGGFLGCGGSSGTAEVLKTDPTSRRFGVLGRSPTASPVVAVQAPIGCDRSASSETAQGGRHHKNHYG